MAHGFSRSWCWTFYDEENVARLRSVPHIAFCCAREVGEAGKTHYQGYIRFMEKKRFSWWKNQFPKEHYEARKGSEAQARAYICDVESYLNTEGAHQKTQGEVLWDYGCSLEVETSGDQMDQVLDKLEARMPRWQIYREHRRFYFTHGHKIRQLDEEMQNWKDGGHDYKRRREGD